MRRIIIVPRMLAYRRFGEQNGIPLVMIHGFLCGGTFFYPNIQHLRYRPIITVDLPGFGDSYTVPSEGTIQDMALRVLETLERTGVHSFHLLGHSMGGMVALTMASLGASPQKLILYATNSEGNLPERFETFEETKKRARVEGLEITARRIIATWFQQGEQHPYFDLCLESSSKVSSETASRALDAMRTFNLTERLPRITNNTLIIGALHDKTYAPQRLKTLANIMPRARVTFMNDCAHNAHLEEPDAFNALLEDFLTSF